MSQPIDEAYVEIRPDLDNFARDLSRGIDQALRVVERGVKRATRDIERSFRDAGDAIDTSISRGARSAEQAVDGLADELGDAGSRAGKEFGDAFTRDANGRLRSGRGQLVKAGEEIGDGLREGVEGAGQGISRVLRGALDTVVSLGSAVVGLGVSAPTPAGLVAIGVAVAGLAAATPVVIALTGALADLAGLVVAAPAGFAVLGAAVAPLVIAFHGFGDAVGAIIDGDPEKITEALEGMAPAARSVLKEFQRLLPSFRSLGDQVQQSFFRPLRGSFTEVSKALLPTLKSGLTLVGRELGQLAAEFGDILKAPQTIAFLNDVFATTARLIDGSGTGLQGLVDIFTTLGTAGLPVIERFGTLLVSGAERLATFVDNAAASGALDNFLNDAVATLGDLVGLLRSLGGLFLAVFGNADDEGRGFVQTLTAMVDELAAFFRSAEGQEALQNLLDLLPLVASQINNLATAVAVGAQVLNRYVDFINVMIGFWGEVISTVAVVGRAIGGAFTTAWEAVSNFFTSLGAFFTSLPGRIVGWLAAFGNALVTGLAAAFNAALIGVGVSIGLILFAILRLPSLILSGLAALPGLLATFFTMAFNRVLAITVTVMGAVVSFITSLPGRIAAGLAALPGIIAGAFNRAVSSARSGTTSGFNSVISFIASIPGRIAGLGPRFVAAGKNLISGFFSGLKSAAGFAGDVGQAIFSVLKSSLNRVIGSINSGIGRVDALLPGSLPRIPMLATGGMTLSPMLAALSETGKREVVLPVDDPRTMAALREGLGLGSGFGAGVAAEPPVPVVHVYLGTREITDILDVRIHRELRAQARKLAARPRTP